MKDYPTSIEEAVKVAQTEMQKQGVHPKAGVCFVSTRIHTDSSGKKNLEICQAGDASLILVDKQGSVKFASDDESFVTALIKAGAISILYGIRLFYPPSHTHEIRSNRAGRR